MTAITPAHVKLRCGSCKGETEVEGVQAGSETQIDYCPLCGAGNVEIQRL
ncbi:hypothetical protein [Halorubrum tebenquichense]|uniref:Small CPxCG-related zinc finger protein n=1 Tax=Halorubrum tebenquichense DSM 14210 TaxID=1227485 RepID=M0E255_9EURY|nr:hypothetical protein [Halorubrum tebenquichense]ELZ41871.1 hypothetical protein C472_00469 [Halorubrum tebenquichense DSM 14210]